ncbi:2-polyprenyl-3-methyl-6-methoxy-1,4-benzoquinone monooxygenase [Verticiella sediminum]|uniref:3-demethoxyubiquinol 3-hydroxylase n=1 Tax=Verticiella sediminum TaxID=1247510 RepID=A0A556AFE8_9BURK|nr:2-polyprenyl-3-methyl-6-methoxy-1,4-benzoquinone monooxygenase [Verticiella sediminum]TSH91583.1 2-polyprenyl-3-methyl-6-methoxy-1,4-benzoquinone monooxygenase [Verticiella sediminum]
MPELTTTLRRPSLLDAVLGEANRAMQVLSGVAPASRRNPADVQATAEAGAGTSGAAPAALTPQQARHAAGLMRVNHVGEICAQALYRGQAAVCRDAATRELFEQSAQEEVDHLAWLGDRLRELNSRPSLLNPLWYAGSFALGVLAGKAGERYSLGFMAETEKQVGEHLDSHLQKLPENDVRSRRIVEQMALDEAQHRQRAEAGGGAELPLPARKAMRGMSRVMTSTAYWI